MAIQQKDKKTLVRVKYKFQVTLPASLREALDLHEGDLLEASLTNNRISLNPKILADRPAIDAAFEEGVSEYRKGGGSRTFANVAEFKAAQKP